MMPAVDELRPLTAGRLLEIRRQVCADNAEDWAVAAECNARVLAECCYDGGERVFHNAAAVLDTMTFREMERLLGYLTGEEPRGECSNPQFDPARFRVMKEA